MIASPAEPELVPGLVYGTARARFVLAATVVGSALAFIDGTVVNVALPHIGEALDARLSQLVWVVNGYALTLAALILLGGSLGDRFGRRRVFVIGVIWFAVASALCAAAPGIDLLIAARGLQGIGGALLTPGSLAILQSSFRVEDRSRAIGAWSGLGGIAGAAGPLLGGWLVDVASWRWIFLINLPFAAAVIWMTLRYVPESRDATAGKRIDAAGAVLGALGLGALTFGLSAWQDHGLAATSSWGALVLGVIGLAAFVAREHWAAEPMLPLRILASPLFSAVNVVTFAVYAALSALFFWILLDLQVVVGFSALDAGLSLLPVTVVMVLLSARMGALAQRIGAVWPLTFGPLLAAAGTVWLGQIGRHASYLRDVLPPMLLFALGLATTVAPLTATVLGAMPDKHAGLASGVNNAVARVAGLLSVAILPLVVGLSGEAYAAPGPLSSAYRQAMWWCAGLLALGGGLSAVFVRRPKP